MKKKIISLCLVVCLLATAIVGGTLAYFTDTDAQKNTFTTGNVSIDLWEDFGDNDEEGIEELIPATGSAQNGTLKNGIEKEVYVTNTGSEDAFVRVHIAIPSILDDGDPSFDAGKNILHFNYDEENSIGKGKWDWSKAYGDDKYVGAWNFYKGKIGDVDYNVYVVTYETALKKGESTVDAMSQVYLDSKVTNKDITDIKKVLGDEWYIYVAAEATQAAGFEDAYTALNTAFGTPGEGYATKIAWDKVTGRTWVDVETATEVENEGDVLLTADTTITANSVLPAGATYDGNGKTLTKDNPDTITGTNAGIVPTSGTIKNVTIEGDSAVDANDPTVTKGFRAVYATSGLTGELVIDNSILTGTYAININGGAYNAANKLIVKNSILNGWVSFSGCVDSAEFTAVAFNAGNDGYANIRPYANTVFTNCSFSDDSTLDTGAKDITIKFVNCDVNGTLITATNVVDLLNLDEGDNYGEYTVIVEND
ncbi:MAG: hypothetical protein J6D42_04075 [Clostridia bacterium]|nr:hypothetical protein [Clostridia bacterium]